MKNHTPLDDVTRMQRCLQEAKRDAERDEVFQAWSDYSATLCAGWMALPENDELLLKILLEHLPPEKLKWQITILDAGDDSGDGMLQLPDELLDKLGWKMDDQLSIFAGEESSLILKRHP